MHENELKRLLLKADKYIKKTFEVEPELLKTFMHIVSQKGMRVKDAVNQAIQDWIDNQNN